MTDSVIDLHDRNSEIIPASVLSVAEVSLPPTLVGLRRILKAPAIMPYNRLIAFVVLVNVALLGYGVTHAGWWSGHAIDLRAIVTVAQCDFAVAIVLRQQYVINFLCWLAIRPPTSWPLRLRWGLAKVYHFGGVHVGAAVSGTGWYLIFVGSLTYDAGRGVGHVSPLNLVLSYLLIALFLAMIAHATPLLRARFHDHFEVTHRFCGWAAVALVWANTVVFVASQRGRVPLSHALLVAPTLWIIVVTTMSTALPWALLRRVPIRVHKPSDHVALVSFDHGVTPFIGSVRPIGRNPVLGWHTFANIPAPATSAGGYRMAVSRAGDWTSAFINDPPSHVWVRGVPTAGMANVRKLFKKVVYVATGSGIGPMLAHLLANEVPSHLVWVTRNPRTTYGDALVDEILAVQPSATVWDTDEHGKPDVLKLAYAAYLASGAEAVICIANKKVTWQVVFGLESRGIPACGPIWDS